MFIDFIFLVIYNILSVVNTNLFYNIIFNFLFFGHVLQVLRNRVYCLIFCAL